MHFVYESILLNHVCQNLFGSQDCYNIGEVIKLCNYQPFMCVVQLRVCVYLRTYVCYLECVELFAATNIGRVKRL